MNLLPYRENPVPPEYINIIYEFCLARQKHDVRIAAVPELCSTAELPVLNCFAVLNSNFDSNDVLLPSLIADLVLHDRRTESESYSALQNPFRNPFQPSSVFAHPYRDIFLYLLCY